jgi:hypothetical protein
MRVAASFAKAVFRLLRPGGEGWGGRLRRWHLRVLKPVLALVVVVLPATAVAAPVRIQLLGQVEAAYSFQITGLPLPPSIVEGASVAIDLVFEPVVLRYPPGVQPTPGPILEGDFVPHYVPSAEQAVIQLLDGAITIGEEMLHWSDGKLFVTDNRVGGLCAGFNCTSWTSDMIDLIAWGEAGNLGNGVRFSTIGGLSSPQHADGFPPNDTLRVGSDLARLDTWAAFPDSSFYVRFQSADGRRQTNVTIQLTDALAIPEPRSFALVLALVVMTSAAQCCSPRRVQPKNC